MAGERELAGLAQLAAQTVVAAAATDAWERLKAGLARLLGRGDDRRAEAAGQRLEEARNQLAGLAGGELEARRAALAEVWQARLGDALEEHPDLQTGLRALVTLIRTELPPDAMTVSGHSVTAGRDVRITATGGGVAAGVIHGNVPAAIPRETGPGDARGGAGSIVAAGGGLAIGRADRVVVHRSQVPSQPVRLAPRPAFLTGRKDLLMDLAARLSGEGTQPRVVALCGLGGVGKTSLALEYAHRQLATGGLQAILQQREASLLSSSRPWSAHWAPGIPTPGRPVPISPGGLDQPVDSSVRRRRAGERRSGAAISLRGCLSGAGSTAARCRMCGG